MMNAFKNFVAAACMMAVSYGSRANDVEKASPFEGRWDMVVQQGEKKVPSWLEIDHSGYSTLVGRYVASGGSARPIAEVNVVGAKFSFTIPPQWEESKAPIAIEGELANGKMKGTLTQDDKVYEWTAERAPLLKREGTPVWDKPINLFSGTDLKGWHTTGDNQWVVEDGMVRSKKSGSNLVSDQTFTDFKLHVEFRYEKGSNSGVYLRGRYEVQIEDNKGKEPGLGYLGAIYGFITPNAMVAKAAGEWQTYDITLLGRLVTVVANGVTIICNQPIPGITGGALDSNEGEPGPIYFQGDHGPIDFRNIVITPVKSFK